MQFFNALAALAAFATLGTSSYINNPTLKWSDGNLTLYGNLTSIQAQLQALDPNWTPRDVAPIAVPVTMLNSTKRDSGDLIRVREGLISCPVPGQNFVPQRPADVINAAILMSGIGGYFEMGPQQCSEVYQYNGAGIGVCTNSATKVWMEVDIVANYAVSMANGCPSYGGAKKSCGQLFDTDGYNVIITAADNSPYIG